MDKFFYCHDRINVGICAVLGVVCFIGGFQNWVHFIFAGGMALLGYTFYKELKNKK